MTKTYTQKRCSQIPTRWARAFRAGRKCRHCKQKLSIYNAGLFCHAHKAIGIKKQEDLIIKEENKLRKKMLKEGQERRDEKKKRRVEDET